MSGPIEIAVIVVVVGLMVVRRLIGEPVDARRMLLLPAVLTLAGLSDAAQVGQSTISIAFLVGSGAISLLLGVLRGASVRVTDRDGLVFMRYTATTVVLLVTNFAIKIGSGFVLGAVDPGAEHAVSAGLALTFGLGMLAEGLTILMKAARTGGRIAWGTVGDSAAGARGRRGLLSGLLDDVRDLGPRPPDDERRSQRPDPTDR